MECLGQERILKFWHPVLAFKMTKICWNCPTYGWYDPMIELKSDRPLSACKTCKLAMYCSKECQKEHWKKVHKKHCKYLAGTEPSSIPAHGAPADCKKCQSKLADKAGDVYPCHIQQSFPGPMRENMLPGVRQCVPLGEITGHYVSKQDKNISILQQILSLLRELCLEDGADSQKGPFSKLAQCLSTLRIIVWYQSLLSKTEEEIDKNVETNLYEMREDLLFPLLSNLVKCQTSVLEMVVDIIESDKEDIESDEEDIESDEEDIESDEEDIEYDEEDIESDEEDIESEDIECESWAFLLDLWESFILFFNIFLQANFFYRNMFDLQHISSESFEHSEHTLELRGLVFGSNFLTIWDNMLEAAKDKIIPMKELLEIYCDGQLHRTCDVCSAEIQISTFWPFYVLASDVFGAEEDQGEDVKIDRCRIMQLFMKNYNSPCISFGVKQNYRCGENLCHSKADWAMVRSKTLMLSTGQELAEKFVLNRCDSCYRVTEGGHRCSNCKMKVYCSELCQNNDWTVHKICCEDLKKSDDKRKKKEHGRRKAGKKRMVKQAEFCKVDGTSFHMIDAFSKLMIEKGFEAETEEMEKLMEDNSARLFSNQKKEMFKAMKRYLSHNNED